jgi:hypothetical protein
MLLGHLGMPHAARYANAFVAGAVSLSVLILIGTAEQIQQRYSQYPEIRRPRLQGLVDVEDWSRRRVGVWRISRMVLPLMLVFLVFGLDRAFDRPTPLFMLWALIGFVDLAFPGWRGGYSPPETSGFRSRDWH